MLITANTATHGAHTIAPSGSKPTATRRQPYAPSFITTPASSILAAVGAAEWPCGAHVWNGHMPAKIAKPTNITGNTTACSPLEKSTVISTRKSKVFNPEAKNSASIPINTNALPPKEYITSFIAAYSRFAPPQMAIRKYLGTIAIS